MSAPSGAGEALECVQEALGRAGVGRSHGLARVGAERHKNRSAVKFRRKESINPIGVS